MSTKSNEKNQRAGGANPEAGTATGAETGGLDYQQLAQTMLTGWQDQWRQFATNKDNPFVGANPYGEILQAWGGAVASAMSGAMGGAMGGTVAGTTTGAATETTTGTTNTSAPAAEEAKNAAPKSEPQSQSKPQARSEPSAPSMAAAHNASSTQNLSAAPAAASSARDVLLTELARRVEFLHERVVALESELDRIKGCK